MTQHQLIFFGENHKEQLPAPDDEWKKWWIDRDNIHSPFHRFIGNDKAIRKIQAAAYTALGRENHQMSELAFGIFGPASAGKTTLARIYAETVHLPFMEVGPKSLKTVDDLFRIIRNSLGEAGLPLVEVSPKHFILPPCVVFIDEVHTLVGSVVDGLLKATEYNDATMVTESGFVANTMNVTWMIATTDEGKLFDAFRTRFSPINLQYLNKVDVAKIVKLANPDWSDETCALVAHYNSRIPRKALEFARYMRMLRGMEPSHSWSEIASEAATNEGIDQYGMAAVHLKILRALAAGPIAKNRMHVVAGRKEDEVENYILPWLLAETDDQPALITVTPRGYVITEAGLVELEKRK